MKVVTSLIETAQAALHSQITALQSLRLDTRFEAAVDLLLNCRGKIIVMGVGKSGYVGQKIAATLCSTGTPAFFLHPTEALHGDLGLYTPGDTTILISKSGATEELIQLVPLLRQRQSPLIGLIGNALSPLAKLVDVVLDVTVPAEADPYNLIPTSSTTASMVLGDVLAIAVMLARGFTPQDFARSHPGGQLGRNLHLRVMDVLHSAIAWVEPGSTVKDVVMAMSQFPWGAACVVNADHHLLGLITEGDIRRALMRDEDIRHISAEEIMTRQPVTIPPHASLHDALQLMENRMSAISVLPVVQDNTCLGLVRIHDIYQDKN